MKRKSKNLKSNPNQNLLEIEKNLNSLANEIVIFNVHVDKIVDNSNNLSKYLKRINTIPNYKKIYGILKKYQHWITAEPPNKSKRNEKMKLIPAGVYNKIYSFQFNPLNQWKFQENQSFEDSPTFGLIDDEISGIMLLKEEFRNNKPTFRFDFSFLSISDVIDNNIYLDIGYKFDPVEIL